MSKTGRALLHVVLSFLLFAAALFAGKNTLTGSGTASALFGAYGAPAKYREMYRNGTPIGAKEAFDAMTATVTATGGDTELSALLAGTLASNGTLPVFSVNGNTDGTVGALLALLTRGGAGDSAFTVTATSAPA